MLKSLWIMRHGLAENEFDSDFNRALSEAGQLEAESVAQQILADGGELPDKMLVSPFRRTQETAKIVHRLLGLEKPFVTEEMLVHFADHKTLGDFLLTLERENVMVVSHMPIVARLCQYLVVDCSIYGFRTAQVVKLKIEADQTLKIEKQYLAEV